MEPLRDSRNSHRFHQLLAVRGVALGFAPAELRLDFDQMNSVMALIPQRALSQSVPPTLPLLLLCSRIAACALPIEVLRIRQPFSDPVLG